MARFLFLIMLFGWPAQAQVAQVRGGEHPDFTRIVIEGQDFGDWRFGRGQDGYALKLAPSVAGFDLARAFDRIPKDRVSALWHDPDTGQLLLALSCRCHAVAFEFRPNFVVVDIKEGLPDPDSPFERSLDPQMHVPKLEEANALPHGLPEERVADMPLPPAPVVQLQTPPVVEPTRIEPLRDALLLQISRGVAEGVIDLAEPVPPSPHAEAFPPPVEGARISLGALPGIAIAGGDHPLTAEGTECIRDAELAVLRWLPAGAAEGAMVPSRANLLGEFDAPQLEAVLAAARTHLALGFGAEARQILDFMADETEDIALLRSLGHLVDLESPQANPFHNMHNCDSAAALWAVVSAVVEQSQVPNQQINTTAVSAAFSALPLALRRHLGPVLVESFMDAGDTETASRLRDAILRAAGDAGPKVSVMESAYLLSIGATQEARVVAEEAMADPRSLAAEAVIALTEAAFLGDQTIATNLPDQIAALLHEGQHGALAAKLQRALMLAAAMTGDFDRAFATEVAAPESLGDLWKITAKHASDDVFLREAIDAASEENSTILYGPATEQEVAMRLLALGFPDQAKAWLNPVTAHDTEERRLLIARAELALRDARSVLRHLVGLSSPEAERLRAVAVLQLGDASAAVGAYQRAGDVDAAQHATITAADWPTVAEAGPEGWREAAVLAAAAEQQPSAPFYSAVGAPGLIQQSTDLADQTAAARTIILTLLNLVP